MKRMMISAAAIIAAAAGTASQANAARFFLTAGGTLYTANFYGTVQSASLGLGTGQRSPALAFDSNRTLYAAVNNPGSSSADLYKISGINDMNAFNPVLTFVSSLASPTNSFDFAGREDSERLIGMRNRAAGDAGSGMVYFQSDNNSYTSFSDTFANNGAFGNGSLPSTGYDSVNKIYYGVTAGISDGNRRIVTIDRATGVVSSTGLSMVFDGIDDAGDAGYGRIVLAGGDYLSGTYYISFWSTGLEMAVIGSIDLTNGAFTELAAFDVGSEPVSMGLAVIPTPFAGGMSATGLLLVGARRRRNG